MKTLKISCAYELAKDFENKITEQDMTDSEFEARLSRMVGGEWEISPTRIMYAHSFEPVAEPIAVLIALLKNTKIEPGYWTGCYTGHIGELLLSKQDSKEKAEAWIDEMKDNVFSTALEMYEVKAD